VVVNGLEPLTGTTFNLMMKVSGSDLLTRKDLNLTYRGGYTHSLILRFYP
jgi:hypothetical protein